MKWHPLAVVLTATAFIWPSQSGASTPGTNSHQGPDGYFCTSNGYLAYNDVEEQGTEDVVIAHSVKIVRVGGDVESILQSNSLYQRHLGCFI